MTDRSRVLRTGVRATTGILITAVTATAVVLLGGVQLPEVESTPLAVPVDTAQSTTRTLVCSGSFVELGVDPEQPEATTKTGDVDVVDVGESESAEPLSSGNEGDGSEPSEFVGDAGTHFGAAQRQQVETEEVRGTAASACTEPVNEQWIVGGETTTGTSMTLSVSNPGDVPATVQVQLYDENGPVASGQTTGVLVPPKSQRTVSLNGYAPDRERLAARVISTGATVSASAGIGQTNDITPFSAGSITRQLEPQTRLVIPGVTNRDDLVDNHASDAGSLDEYSVIVRTLATGDAGGTATARAVDPDGESYDLGSVELEPGVVSDIEVDTWPEDAQAVIIDSDVPVVGGALGSVEEDGVHDNAWFTPAPELPADEAVAAPVVSGGELVLVNPSDADATVRLEKPGDPDARAQEVEVPAGGAVLTEVSSQVMLRSDDPVHAGVQVRSSTRLAGYPILPLSERAGEITVYPR